MTKEEILTYLKNHGTKAAVEKMKHFGIESPKVPHYVPQFEMLLKRNVPFFGFRFNGILKDGTKGGRFRTNGIPNCGTKSGTISFYRTEMRIASLRSQ